MDDELTLARALRAIEESGEDAAAGVAALETALARGESRLEQFAQAFHRHAASLRTTWRRAVDDMLGDLSRWLEGVNGLAGASSDTPLESAGALGTLASLAYGGGKAPRVRYAHPSVPRAPGSLTPELVDAGGRTVAVTVAEGAVQIHAQTLDESALARAAEALAAQVQARLAFEDRRAGRL
jgi:hypothetical protein